MKATMLKYIIAIIFYITFPFWGIWALDSSDITLLKIMCTAFFIVSAILDLCLYTVLKIKE